MIIEAQASGLPVIAVAEGGPLSIVEDGVTGLLREPWAGALAEALCDLAAQPLLRERLTRAGLAGVRERTWDRAMGRLADGYRAALAAPDAAGARQAA